MHLLACDPGAHPGYCWWVAGAAAPAFVHHDYTAMYERFSPTATEWDAFVIEDQHPATHIYRDGKKVRVSRKSQQGLSFTAGRLFERTPALAKYRLPVDVWRRKLWPTASRLPKKVVLARLREDWPSLVEHLPARAQPDCLESVGIAQAFLAMTPLQRKTYLVSYDD